MGNPKLEWTSKEVRELSALERDREVRKLEKQASIHERQHERLKEQEENVRRGDHSSENAHRTKVASNTRDWNKVKDSLEVIAAVGREEAERVRDEQIEREAVASRHRENKRLTVAHLVVSFLAAVPGLVSLYLIFFGSRGEPGS